MLSKHSRRHVLKGTVRVRRLPCQGYNLEVEVSGLKTLGRNTVGSIPHRRGIYKTRKKAKADVFDYIECFYNPKRRHSTIGYVSPAVFESMQYA